MMERRIFRTPRTAASHFSGRRGWLYPLACPLVLVTPFLGFIEHHDYGFLAPEVLAIVTALAAAGLVLGLVLLRAGTRARALVLFVLLVLFADIQFGWNNIAERPQALLSLAILPLAWMLRTHLAEIATAAFAAILLSTLLLPGAPTALETTQPAPKLAAKLAKGAPSRAELPPVLHLVLDEHAGLEGFSTRIDGGAELRDQLRAFYAERGFRLYAKAYSRHAETAASLAHTVNLFDSVVAVDGGLLVRDGTNFRLTRNGYFERLRAAGYRLRVHQTGYLDLCGALDPAPAICHTSDPNDLRAVRDSRLPTDQKADAIAKLYLERSAVHEGLRMIYGFVQIAARHGGLDAPVWPLEPFRVSALPALAALDEIEASVARAEAGDFIFGHVLLPHYPYALTTDCGIRPPRDWLGRASVFLPGRLGLATSEAFTRALHRRYYQQVGCLYRRLDRILEAVSKSPFAENFVVVLHGDHGAKIQSPLPLVDNLADLTRDRFIENYATLFAVRAPGVAPGTDQTRRAVQDLVAALADGGFTALDPAAATPERDFVYVSETSDPLSYGAQRVSIVEFDTGALAARPSPAPAPGAVPIP